MTTESLARALRVVQPAQRKASDKAASAATATPTLTSAITGEPHPVRPGDPVFVAGGSTRYRFGGEQLGRVVLLDADGIHVVGYARTATVRVIH